jgi:hypothetical protein
VLLEQWQRPGHDVPRTIIEGEHVGGSLSQRLVEIVREIIVDLEQAAGIDSHLT